MSILPSVTCPVCGQPAMSLLRRFSMGPMIPEECKSCARPLGVRLREWLLVSIPMFTAVIALILIFPEALLAVAAGGFAAGALLTRFVPLAPR